MLSHVRAAPLETTLLLGDVVGGVASEEPRGARIELPGPLPQLLRRPRRIMVPISLLVLEEFAQDAVSPGCVIAVLGFFPPFLPGGEPLRLPAACGRGPLQSGLRWRHMTDAIPEPSHIGGVTIGGMMPTAPRDARRKLQRLLSTLLLGPTHLHRSKPLHMGAAFIQPSISMRRAVSGHRLSHPSNTRRMLRCTLDASFLTPITV